MNLISILITLISLAPFVAMRITNKYFYFSLFAVFAIILHGIYLFGYQIIWFILIIYIVSTIAELISLKTSYNFFGVKYRYNLNHSYFSSGINLLGVYPIEVSFTWIILKYVSFNIAFIITQAFLLTGFWIIILTPLILLSLDLIIDPVAVKIAKMWKWEKGSKYFGIPYQNFLGWFFVGLVSSVLFSSVGQEMTAKIDILYLLPVVFYALIIKNTPLIYKLNKIYAILGSLPAIIWTFLALISFFILYSKVYW